jgi:tetratricopeptide (TPR) repeat protein
MHRPTGKTEHGERLAHLVLLAALALSTGLGQSADAARVGAFTPRPEDRPASTGPAVAPVPAAEPASATSPLAAEEARLVAAMGHPPVDLDRVFRLAAVRADLALEAHGRGDLPTALDYLLNSLAVDPDQPERWERYGDWSQALGTPDGNAMAYYAYSEAVALVPAHPRAHLKLAAIAAGHGDAGRAVEHLEQALAAGQDEAPEWNRLALLVTLYLQADRPVDGLNFLQGRYDATHDDRYLLAVAVLMDALGQGGEAARLAGVVAASGAIPAPLREYAERLQARFAAAGERALYGLASAQPAWGAQK